ncbi:MAG: hypothetical protein FJ095_03580 [Deltaproteobacteria bacterium]|nr:hypothetical protein [Deltaproteobacteria bacterium]
MNATMQWQLARRRSRRGERGAAIFIVLLVISLMSALGMYAVRSASLADLASGYNRQQVQTHYVADYAVSALSADISTEPNKHAQNMEKGKGCLGYDKLTTPSCARYSLSDLQTVVKNVSKSGTHKILSASTASDAGSLSQPGVYLEGDMKIEMTDKHPAWPPVQGNQVNSIGGGSIMTYVMVTISAEGMVRPKQTTAGTWDTASATAAGVELSRANVIMGPVPQ